nr:butyrophilin subfamily 3 member A2-like [Caretta caretta]
MIFSLCQLQEQAAEQEMSSYVAFVDLSVGSDPDIPVEGHQDGGIRVVCRSFGWYPEPEAQWRDLQGQVLPSASHNILQEATGLFQTEIAIVITEESNQKVSCSVRNPCLNQERVSTISIADLFFTFHIWVVALGVILGVIFCVLIALASYCSWSQCRAKETLQSAMERQKCQCLGPMGWVEDFMS